MPSKQSVLIVDRSAENRVVLRAALERRGVEILEANRYEAGLQLARRHHPDLIVLDLEAAARDEDRIAGEFDEQAQRDHVPLVLIGTARRSGSPAKAAAGEGQFVTKPYHYGPLIRKIGALLESHPPSNRAA